MINSSPKNSTDSKTYKQLFKALSVALYYEQDRKQYHGFSVALAGEKLAEESGLTSPQRIFYTGLLHDLGGVGLDHHIVHYQLVGEGTREKYPDSELRQARRHGPIGAERLKTYEGFQWALDPMRDHHERYDGSGFPQGKSGEGVPVEAGIIGAADILDIFLCTLNGGEPTSTEELAEGFRDFLKVRGGFRKTVRDRLLGIVAGEDLTLTLLSGQRLENRVEEKIDDLPPPGRIRLEEIVQLLGAVIDIKSNYTEDHSDRVATLGEKVGERLDMSKRELRNYRYAAYLHDLGKVGIDRSIINKPDSLTEEEYEEIKKHPTYSEEILAEIEELEEVAEIAGQHQEKYDGTGYPKGLEGEEISLGARIIAVVDAWDAMRTDRPYQDALPKDVALQELRENAGTQFDPEVVEEFLAVKEGL